MQALSLADIRYSWDRDQHYLLDGIIEMDEAYLGVSKHGKKRGRSTDQRKIAVMVSKDNAGLPKFVHLQNIPDIKSAETAENFV